MKTAHFLLLMALSITPSQAETRIAVLDFELNDLTMKPRIPEEMARTASIKPLLERELQSAGADYVLVGRLHKPSFLFAYLMGHLVRVKDGRLVGNYISESKGGDKKLTQKAVESLTVKIDADLDKRYTPPPPGQSH